MIDTWTLRVLVEVAERGSFSAAAEALSMTQPAVSRQISGLERRLGTPLFRRVPRGVRLLQTGVTAVELARDILARMRALEANLSALADLEAGHLRLAAFPTANAMLVPEAIRRFTQRHPRVAVSLIQAGPSGPLAAIRDGALDLAMITAWQLHADPHTARHDLTAQPVRGDELDGVELTPLLDEQLLIALPADHRLAGRKRVPLRELAGERWIDGTFPDCLGPIPNLAEALGCAPRIGFFCDDWNGKQALVASHAGVMLVPALTRHTVHKELVLRPTQPALPPRRLHAATASPPYRPPAAAAMVGILAELTRRLG